MQVRAKFKCNGINFTQQMVAKPGVTYDQEKRVYVDPDGEETKGQPYHTLDMPTVILNPVYAGADATPENKAFWDATPNGKLEMSITNGEAAEFFTLGKEYYLTFERADA